MCPTRHPNRPPDVLELLKVLHAFNVQYVLVGSVAAAMFGVEVQPGDLDIVPALDAANVDRLVGVLSAVEAAPNGPFGSWRLSAGGEWKWTARPTSENELAEWVANARDVDSLDHLFITRWGNLDVVPKIAGTYETLRQSAVARPWHGLNVYVAHVDELLARLTVPRRDKDRDRVSALRNIQRHIRTHSSSETQS